MQPIKGLILAGGTGSRLRPLTYTGAKQLLPVANRPILFYAVEDLVEAGITDIGLVVGDTGREVAETLGDGEQFSCRITYIRQQAPLGLADAVRTGRQFLGADPFCMFLGDNLLRAGVASLVERFREDEPDAAILLAAVPDPRQFGVAVVEEGRVVKLVEKPAEPISPYALVGAYCFTAAIHPIIDQLKPSWRGEYEITDALQGLIDQDRRVEASFVDGWWKDTGRPEDLLEANRLILEDLSPRNQGNVDVASHVIGRVAIGRGTRIINSVIRGPVSIADDVTIAHAYVGPYTSIGPHVIIENVEVEHSVIMADAQIQHLGRRLDESLIGRGVILDGRDRRPRTIKLVLGDKSQGQGI